MFGSVILEVAIALGLLYAVLSIASSALTEGISSLFSLRARTLRTAIVKMLGGAEGHAREFLTHPLLKGIAPRRPFAGPAREMPDHVSARTFATALFDTLSLLRPSRSKGKSDDLPARIAEVESEPLRRTLQSLMHEAGSDMACVREAVESWFDDAMVRVRSLYTARAVSITLVIAFVAVAFINADTIMFSKEIYANSNLRMVLVGQARGLQFDEPDGGLGLEETVALLQLYPLGWSSNPEDPRAFPRSLAAIATKIGGLLITVLAVSMGAPFWFDTLRRLVNLRTAPRPGSVLADRRAMSAEWGSPPDRGLGPEAASARPVAGRSRGRDRSRSA